MKKLQIVSNDTIPAIPTPNTLVVVDGTIVHYDNNGTLIKISSDEDEIDLSEYATILYVDGKLEGKSDITHTHSYTEITGKPTTFAPVIGTTATTAKAGNYQPTWAQVTGKPTTFEPIIGTTATTAKAGNYRPTIAEITDAFSNIDETQREAIKVALGLNV